MSWLVNEAHGGWLEYFISCHGVHVKVISYIWVVHTRVMQMILHRESHSPCHAWPEGCEESCQFMMKPKMYVTWSASCCSTNKLYIQPAPSPPSPSSYKASSSWGCGFERLTIMSCKTWVLGLSILSRSRSRSLAGVCLVCSLSQREIRADSTAYLDDDGKPQPGVEEGL